MRRNLRSVIGGAAVLSITGGILAATVGTAAASFPSTLWQPDPNAVGTLAFYNAAGHQVTSGTDDSHLGDYVLASSNDPSAHPGAIANLEFAKPVPGANTGTWPTAADESSATPNSSAPGALASATHPLVTLDAGGANLQAAASGFTANTTAGYVNVYQVRVYTTGGGGTGSGSYWDADILINPTTNAWTELDGTAVSSTVTAVAGTPNPASLGSSVSLSATVTMADGSTPAGTLTFTSGGNTVGTTSTFSASGVGSATTTALPQGTDTITATFVPSTSGTVTYAGSSGTGSQVISPPATTTNTSLTVAGDYQDTTGPATLSGAVTPLTAPGTVSLYDNGTLIPGSAQAVTGTGTNAYSFNVTSFSAGSHSIVAKFAPTDPATFAPSQSAAQPFTTLLAGGICTNEAAAVPAGPDCTDTQNIKATIPAGTLVISTPYTAANPLNLGTLALNSGGTAYSGSAAFTCITITDTEGTNTGFQATAQSSDLASESHPGQTIDSQNVGLTGLAPSPATETCNGGPAVNSYTGAPASIHATDNPAAAALPAGAPGTAGLGGGVGHLILNGTANDVGTATYDGSLTLTAPTNTAPGTFDGTIIFTVSDGE